MIGANPLGILFNKVEGFIRIYDGSRYLVLFGPGKQHAMNNRIRYLVNQKSDITYVFSYHYAKSKIDFYDFLPL